MTKTKENITLIVDRLETYGDFIDLLSHYISRYYIDDGSFNKNDVRNFHKWCFQKTSDDFKLEGIDFSENETLEKRIFKYNEFNFFEFNDCDLKKMIGFWNDMLSVDKIKNRESIRTLIDFYKLFDRSVEKKYKKSEINEKKTCMIKE